MNYDEFMRRTLKLTEIPGERRRSLAAIGQAYLTKTRAIDRNSRALALASYEDGGLESVFRAILTAEHWEGPLYKRSGISSPSTSGLTAIQIRATEHSAGISRRTNGSSRYGLNSANANCRNPATGSSERRPEPTLPSHA